MPAIDSIPGVTGPGLHQVLPSVVQAMGWPAVPWHAGGLTGIPAGDKAVVVMLDGLGDQQLAHSSGNAPWLSRVRATSGQVLNCGFPSTTATSIATFGTGTCAGVHGLVGTSVVDPDSDQLFSQLAWDTDVDPRIWQPHTTVFEHLVDHGVGVTMVGPQHFGGSGMSTATTRGGAFLPAQLSHERIDRTLEALRDPGPQLVYLYWGDIDKAGHLYGWQSWQWGHALTVADEALARVATQMPARTTLVITADHGMVDLLPSDQYDVAYLPELQEGVRHLGGEGRAVHLYCDRGAADAVARTWQNFLGGSMVVRTRERAVAEGWFGPVVTSLVLPRIGDVVTSASGPVAVVDSRTVRSELLGLIGHHGGHTLAETQVPFLVWGS